MAKTIGIDVSRWNTANAIKAYIKELGNVKFMIAKATEGKTYRDPEFVRNLNIAVEHGLLFGAYHFARPENGNSPYEEAMNFCNVIKNLDKCVLALDFEQKALMTNEDWIIGWLNVVEDQTGKKPIVYIPISYFKKAQTVASRGYKLWYPRYNGTMVDSKTVFNPWSEPAIWQFKSNPIDTNILYGTPDDFAELMKSTRKYVNSTYPEYDGFKCDHVDQIKAKIKELEEMVNVWEREEASAGDGFYEQSKGL